jgi:hypothetical protein
MPPSARPASPPAAATAAASRLANVQRGVKRTPRRVFVYGDGGLGKTTLAAGMARPIFIDVNQGSSGFHVTRYVFEESTGRTKPANFEELLSAVTDVAANSAGNYDTLVVDVLSDVEPLIFAEVVRRDGKAKNITDGNLGYNKGYEIAIDEWRRLVAELEAAWRAGLHIVLLDHTEVKKEKNREGADYGRGMPKIHTIASKFINQWSDFTFFLEVEMTLVPDNPDERKKKKDYAISDGKRILHGRPAAEHMAKSRPEVVDPIELPPVGGWPVVLRAIIAARVAQLGEADASKVIAALERAGDDVAKLEELDAWCAVRPVAPSAPPSNAPPPGGAQ